ncbi:hypothetical protein PCANC_01102 [Puccinia coronata f. sp. avenae]|uniref:Uncharacterized protein n=1 Tax=Puccinia coronata f. sp. avenae TaxID=200324 RepID=A0A2N5W5X0_9BASI|nr:hypothetical protein PCANC_01102 [Puccinia coronata f. sp. avenae]
MAGGINSCLVSPVLLHSGTIGSPQLRRSDVPATPPFETVKRDARISGGPSGRVLYGTRDIRRIYRIAVNPADQCQSAVDPGAWFGRPVIHDPENAPADCTARGKNRLRPGGHAAGLTPTAG